MKKNSRIIAVLMISVTIMTGCNYKSVVKNHRPVDMNTEIDNYFVESGFTGEVLVAKQQGILYARGMGEANEEGRRLTPEIEMEIGSVTKQMTAAVVLNLADEGFFSLDDTVDTYLEDISYGDRVTIRSLLNMVSGIPEYMDDEDILSKDPMDVIKGFSIDEKLYGKFNYSNSNYYLLGKIIENATGRTYEDVLKEYVFEEVAMFDSKLDVCCVEPAYMNSGDDVVSFPIEYTYAAGGIKSNVYDLYDWEKAYWSGDIIPKENMNELLNTNSGYLYGWNCADGTYSHAGQTKYFASIVYYDAKDGSEVIILTNDIRIDNKQIVKDLLKIINKYY